MSGTYSFTVHVREGRNGLWWVKLERHAPPSYDNEFGVDYDWFEFPTKEEADTHAALILSALHEAVME